MAGKGSIEKRGVNTWRLVASCGMKDGRQVKKTKNVTVKVACDQKSCKGCTRAARCQARREAEKLLAEFVLEIEKGTFIEPTKLTFKDFVERWLRDYGEKNLAPKTLFRYRQILESRVLPAMGHLKVEQIRPTHLLEFYANLQEDGIREDGKPGGLSEKTILQHHRIISSILNDAVEWQVIPSNPAARVKPPRVTKKQTACYDEEQTAALLEALEHEEPKYKVLINLALFTGLRRGEIMGLEWRHIDFKEGTLMVEQASQYLPGQGTFTKTPKNETSARVISLPAFLVDMLRQHKKGQVETRLKVGDMWQGSDRIFTTWDGRPMHPDTVSSWFPKFLKRHDLPPLPFHGLRHTAATMMINAGVPAKVVSGHFGHANIGTTYDIYGHFLRSADKEAANRLEQTYQRIKENGKEIKQGQA
ncbi:MAG: site-specific integrase [Peptococcaceae bacterium]|nr:site-specific integrase [Peptococcaceae bacterium]